MSPYTFTLAMPQPPRRPPLIDWTWWARAGWQQRLSARVFYVAQWRPPFAHHPHGPFPPAGRLLLPRVGTPERGFSFPLSVVRLRR